MPKTILQVSSSPLGDKSASRKLSASLIERLLEQHPNSTLINRDLTAQPLPHLDGLVVSGFYTPPEQRNETQKNALMLSTELINELRQADIIVIGAPMHNFSIPSSLKAWIDHVARAGETFRYSENGAEGLLVGKKIYVASTRGGVYTQGPLASLDHQESYLKMVLGFIGLTDVNFIRAEGMSMGDEVAKQAVAHANAQIQQFTTKTAT